MSYSIRGTVIDINTQNPAPGLNVAICDPNNSEILFTTTADATGLFSISLTVEQRVQLSAGSLHRALVFKVYEGPYFLGAQEIVVCESVFVGSHPVRVEVDTFFDPPEEGCVYAVAGCLVEADGTPVANAEVNLFERTLSGQSPLDSRTTNAKGEFMIRYFAPAGSFPDQADISIELEAIDNGNTVATLGPICNPVHDLTVTMVVGDVPLRGPSEQANVTRTLTPLLDGKTYEQLTPGDVDYLVCKTGFEASLIAILGRAHQLAIDFSVPSEAFYALGRAGFPLGPTALVGIDDSAITSVIQQAVADNIVTETIAAQLPSILAAFAAKRLDRAIPQNDPTSTTLGAVMATASYAPTLPRDFVEKHAAFVGDDEAFWTFLRGEPDYGDAIVEELQFTLAAGAVTASYVNMVKLLQVKRTQAEVSDPRDLARYSAQDWIAFTSEIVDGQAVGAPAGLPGDTDAERATAFGHAIARMVEDLYPTSFTAHHLTPGLFQSDILAFTQANPDFSFTRTVIDGAFFDQAQGVPNDPQLAATLKAELEQVQRVFSVAPRFGRSAAVNTLLTGGISSAYQIAQMGPTSFTSSFLSGLGSQEAVDSVFRAAHRSTAMALTIFSKTRPEFSFPSMQVFTTPGCSDPDLETLFGSLDYCECRHCDSIHGPPAYFVDIMQFLRLRSAAGANAYTELTSSGRRPDLPRIELSCENTETPLPAIDLVNEVLEQAIRDENGLAVENSRQTMWRAADLLAHPEHLDLEVYDILADHTQAYHPWILPFNLYIEESRGYLTHLGVNRLRLLDLFDSPFPTPSALVEHRVDETLGLSPGQASIVRSGQGTPPIYQLWGFVNEGTWADDLNDVETFIEKSHLSLESVQELLQTSFFVDVEIDYETPCQLQGAQFKNNGNPGLNESTLTKIHTFLRLQLHLGWSFLELDSALEALGLTLDNPASDLPLLAEVVRVHQSLPGTSLFEVLTFWGNLELRSSTEDAPSFYESVVRPELREPAFKDILTDNVTLGEVKGSLQSILGISEDELTTALELAQHNENENLNLDTLSKLYRVSAIARALGVGIEDLSRLVELSNLGDPFSGLPTAPVRSFLERARIILNSPFSPAELLYISADIDPETFGASDSDITSILVGLILGLQQAEADHKAQLPTDDLSPFQRVEILLAHELESEEILPAMAFLRKEAPANATLAEAIQYRNLYFGFLKAGSSAHTSLGKAFADPGSNDPEQRAKDVFSEYAETLRLATLSNLVIQQLSSPLDLEPATTEVLLQTFKKNSIPALEFLSADDFFASSSFDAEVDAEGLKTEAFPKTFLNRAAVIERASLTRSLLKAALVSSRFELQGDLLIWLLSVTQIDDHKAHGFILDLTALDQPNFVDRWLWMVQLSWLRDVVFIDREPLVEILTSIFELAPDLNALEMPIADATGWEQPILSDLISTSGIDLSGNDYQSLRDLTALEAIARVFQTAARIDVDPLTLHRWGTQVIPAELNAQAGEIKSRVQAKYSSDTWVSVAQPLRDVLREKQRDAMVAYLLPKYGLKDREDLLGRFLMDVDISACGKTSRLKSAISAVQLFIQRVLMNLETDIEFSDGDSVEWEWMKRYRVWEANRKIFLYPENWLSPELRDNRTELFRNLESELAQSEADSTSVELAYIHYLEGLNEIARLNICGLYHEVERHGGEVTRDVLHTFGRTHGDPSKLFYREWIDRSHWTPWEELSFTVDSQDVLPVVNNRRLLLIWPQTVERAIEVEPGGPVQSPKKFREIRLAWTEKLRGIWSGPRASQAASHDILPEGFTPLHFSDDVGGYTAPTPNWDLFLASYPGTGGQLRIRVGVLARDSNDTSFPKYYFRDGFQFDDCAGNFVQVTDPGPKLQSGFWEYSLSSHAPPPLGALTRHQGFFSNWLFFGLQLPISFGKGYQAAFSPKIVTTPSEFKTLPPRQHAYIDTRWPQAFQDLQSTFIVIQTQRGGPSYKPDEVGDAASLDKMSYADLVPYLQFDSENAARPDFSQDPNLTYNMVLGAETPSAAQDWGLDFSAGTPRYEFHGHYHAYVCQFLEQVRRHGVPGLLDPIGVSDGTPEALVFQQASRDLVPVYEPTGQVLKPFPVEDIDFSFGGAYSVYNWEIFYHAPMLIADQLINNRQFADAQKWLHYLFDPTRSPTELENTDCRYYWRIKPFREAAARVSVADLLATLSYDGDDPEILADKKELQDQVEDWRTEPFRPHRIARMRPEAYMRATVMKYLDNLIAWGDDLFRQDTIETTNEATQLYILALQILGKRPRKLPPHQRAAVDYSHASGPNGFIDDFSNFFVLIENLNPGGSGKFSLGLDKLAQNQQQQTEPNEYILQYVEPNPGPQPLSKEGLPKPPPPLNPLPLGTQTLDLVRSELYFCIPPNSKLLSYWDTVADRLFKLRNCLNIEGIRRALPLFEPPIDPGLLAKAAAQGVDISTAISNLLAPLPHYRFLVHLGIAKDFAGQVQALGNALLSALEKQDAEGLASLRASQELELLTNIRAVRELAVTEATEALEALQRAIIVAQARRTYYGTRVRVSDKERAAIKLTEEAILNQKTAGRLQATASFIAAKVPNFNLGLSGLSSPVVTTSFGGSNISSGFGAASQRQQRIGAELSAQSQITSSDASYERRFEEWTFQAELASLDSKQIEKQISAATLRLAMAKKEIDNHDKQIANSQETLDYLQSKFSNTELYTWMSGELSKLYYQAYQIASDLARRSERCFQYELADPEASFVTFGHWDNRRKGLLAGERLANDLRRMEAAYYERNRREYELVKRVSLAEHDPVALVSLRKTGSCHFNLPEVLFDLDHPGHYLRRIKMVGVTVPAVTGPYENVNATLTYETGSIRPRPEAELEQDFNATTQSVATSSGEDDTGLFEPNLRDERYLPFEGKGLANSYWRVELPTKLRQFNYDTISDVVLTIRYTARNGGAAYKQQVEDTLAANVAAMTRADGGLHGEGQVHLFSARANFPEAWRAFVTSGENNGAAGIDLSLDEDRFPSAQEPKPRLFQRMLIFIRWSATPPDIQQSLLSPTVTTPGNTVSALPQWQAYKVGIPDNHPDRVWFTEVPPADVDGETPGTWKFAVDTGWTGAEPDDILVLVQYKLGN